MNIVLIAGLFTAQFTSGAGRTLPTVAAVVGLVSVIAGGISLARKSRGTWGRLAAIILGAVALVVGGLHATYAAGGVGTGNGLAGAVVAIALGAVGMLLGSIAFVRAGRTTA